jgi:hypothetical protein
MYSMPIHAIPKPDGSDLRMVTDHSAGRFALNSVIPHSSIIGAPLDNLKHLGSSLLKYRETHGPSAELTILKSDVKGAHRLMPMCFEWQMKQINTIKGCRHIDHCACFGDSGSARIWTSFFCLVLWIAKFIKHIEDLFAYADDSFSVELRQNLLWYPPFQKWLPMKQTQLLLLFDELGIPHEDCKQVSGRILKVIGFEVNTECMTFTMSAESKDALTSFIRSFSTQLRAPFRDFQRLAGWINWALNVFPLLRPSLSNIYAKCSGKSDISPRTLLCLNNSIRHDLNWLLSHMDCSDGVHLLNSISWPVADADTTIFCDACRTGMGFWYPELQLGFFCPVDFPIPAALTTSIEGSTPIFFLEALCVASAIHQIPESCLDTHTAVIYTDNMNSVDMFNSLRALPAYNPLLTSTVDKIISHSFDIRVLHIEGEKNTVADAISRGNFDVAKSLVSGGLTIIDFTPPQDALGAAKNDISLGFVQTTYSVALDVRALGTRALHCFGYGN